MILGDAAHPMRPTGQVCTLSLGAPAWLRPPLRGQCMHGRAHMTYVCLGVSASKSVGVDLGMYSQRDTLNTAGPAEGH